MTIKLHAVGFRLTNGLAERVSRAFHRLDTRFPPIDLRVVLSDINGPHGGDDKRCLVEIHIPRLKRLVLGEIHADMYAAIDRAADRAFQTISRATERCSRRSRLRSARRHLPLLDADQDNGRS